MFECLVAGKAAFFTVIRGVFLLTLHFAGRRAC